MGAETKPTSDKVGIEVHGIKLDALTGEDWQTVAKTFTANGLLIFHDQFLTRDEHVALAARFGRIDEFDTRVPNASSTPFVAREPGIPVITEVSIPGRVSPRPACGRRPQAHQPVHRQSWRTDGSFKEVPVKASILAAVEVPTSGGSTQFADMQTAFEALSEAEQRHLETLTAWHSAVYVRAAAGEIPLTAAEDPTSMTGAAHGVVTRVASGKKALYLGENACCILGMDLTQGQALIERLRSHAGSRRYVYTHQWGDGDVVIWDARRFMHRAVSGDAAHRRVLRHISIAGEN